MQKQDAQVLRTREDVRRYIAERLARIPLDDAIVKGWRAVGRGVLLLVLGYSAVQYYMLTVYVEILSLPEVTVFVAFLKPS